MKSSDIRKTFTDFFEERGHRLVPSSSLVPNDPTLLLTNAGMVQFKPYFLGEEVSDFTRATSVQKCLRTTDIESVGITARHNTFFEMLGNFSFGDYYKESVIPWAWELVTGVFGIDSSTLWISVYEEDEEAESIWKSTPGVSPRQVIRLGAEDNFWDMGATGPCGPCSEILYDRGESFSCGPQCRAGCDCDRFLELWNLVFMQYDRQPDESLISLPKKNIDTGMGLERVAALKQGVSTIFETDLLAPVVGAISGLSGIRLGEGDSTDISIKVVADHSRAATFMIADGIIPSNEGRGYILRRLLRRAVRHGRLLGVEGQFIGSLSDTVIELLGDVYPELKEHHRLVSGVIDAEEERFGQTLGQGVELLRKVIREHREDGRDTIDGKTAFYLHDTLGFPLEVTEEIAADSGMKVDGELFHELMEKQRERARVSREEEPGEEEAYAQLYRDKGTTGFEAYRCSDLESSVLGLLVDGRSVAKAVAGPLEVVLFRTPFYSESGGQVGDTGTITGPDGVFTVEDTYYGAPGLIVHRGTLDGTLRVEDSVIAVVDVERRLAVSRNHSATHLLHWALRQVLGTHAKQAGSLVTPERLRFDFTHFQALTAAEVEEIERLANARVLEDAPVDTDLMAQEEAKAAGAIALFGEKYGETVRVVQMGGFSKELCGGIHVERTGMIGPIKVLSETGIGSGLRRIEATSGFGAVEYARNMDRLMHSTSELLKVRKEEVPSRVAEILARLKELERAAAAEASKVVEGQAGNIAAEGKTVEVGSVRALLARVPGEEKRNMRDLADMVMSAGGFGIVALVGASGKKAQLVVKVDRKLLTKGLDAKEIASAGGSALGGGGGGRPDMALAGGSRIEGLDEALDAVEVAVRAMLGESG